MEAGSIWINLGLRTDDLQFGLDKARYKLSEWRDETNRSTADLTKWGAAIGATVAPALALGTAIYSLQQRFGSMADEITDLSYTTGLSTDKIQQLQYAAKLSDTEFTAVSRGVNQLTLSIAKAGDAATDAGKAFASIGVQTAGRSYDQVFEDTAAALVSMEDTTRRNELAMIFYGQSWKEMLPFMETYVRNSEEISNISLFNEKELQDLKDANKELAILNRNLTVMAGQGLASVVEPAEYAGYEAANFLSRLKGEESQAEWLKNMDYSRFLQAKAGKNGGMKSDLDIQMAAQIAAETEAALAAVEASSKAAYGAMVDQVDAITDAMKDLKSATDAEAAALEKMYDIDKDYARNLQQLDPRDIQGFINLRMRHEWAVEDQGGNIAAAQNNVIEAAGSLGKAGAAAAGININIQGPITVVGDKSFEKRIQEERIRAGVR